MDLMNKREALHHVACVLIYPLNKIETTFKIMIDYIPLHYENKENPLLFIRGLSELSPQSMSASINSSHTGSQTLGNRSPRSLLSDFPRMATWASPSVGRQEDGEKLSPYFIHRTHYVIMPGGGVGVLQNTSGLHRKSFLFPTSKSSVCRLPLWAASRNSDRQKLFLKRPRI